MKRNAEATCGSCLYWGFKSWYDVRGAKRAGDCLRHAPAMGQGSWPVTSENDVCAEHPEFLLKEEE